MYFIVGCLTTLVAAAARFGFNFLFFGGTLHPTFAQNTALAIVDWVAGVAFAYPTNRKWVFQSKNPNILTEAGGFVASRLATLGMDWAVTQLLGTVLGINVYVTWFIKSVLVFLAYLWTLPEPSPDMSFSTSSTVTRLKSCSMECFRQEAAAANSTARCVSKPLHRP